MSTGRSNAMDALPRASFLTYFRNPNQPKRSTSGFCQRGRATCRRHRSQAPLLPRIPEDATIEEGRDDESRLEEFEHFEHCEDSDDDDEQEWSWSDILGFAGYTLLVLLIVLNLDFLLNAYNANTGFGKWDVRRTNASSPGREMHFCMAAQNRMAPTSRVWRYIPRDANTGCTTIVLTIHADTVEAGKLFTQDIISGEVAGDAACERSKGTSKRGTRASIANVELGDDLAEEGALSRKVEFFP